MIEDYQINVSSSGLIYVRYKDSPKAEVFASRKEAEKYIARKKSERAANTKKDS